MSHPANSNHQHVDPSVARMTEDALKQKAMGTQEKRELVGDDEYINKASSITNKNALLENPLHVRPRFSLSLLPTSFAAARGPSRSSLTLIMSRASRSTASRVSTVPL